VAPRRTQTGPNRKTIKRLFALSGNRCAFPGCTDVLVEGDVVVGHICHVKAANPEGPRYDDQQTPAERHGYDNLILMCQKHHTVIDDGEEAYTVERLTRMKADHADRIGRPDNAFGERAATNIVNITIHPGPAKTAAGPRLSVLALVEIATRDADTVDRNWLFAFGQRLRQAGADGTVSIWGIDLKNGWDMKSAPNIYVLDLISPGYFKDHFIDVQQGWLHQENAYVRTSRPAVAEPRFYSNLHVNRAEALEWIGEPDQSVTIGPNFTIRQLFLHISQNTADRQSEGWEVIGRDVIDKFSTGQVAVWGRRINRERGRSALMTVPPDHWHSAKFTYWFMAEDDDRQSLAVRCERNERGAAPYEYCDLRVNRNQAYRIWPR
jgi:hypothetical protein